MLVLLLLITACAAFLPAPVASFPAVPERPPVVHVAKIDEARMRQWVRDYLAEGDVPAVP